MSVDRNDPAARQKAVLAELDAINARRERGEISADEADSQADAVVKRAHEETLAFGRTNRGRGQLLDRIKLVLAYVYIVSAVLVCGYLAVLQLRED